MNNRPLFPFERNRYYAGKMLTSADFAAEQGYMNDKRRFVNTMMFGSGIVCGCNVYSLDDLSVFVESGFAIDRLGREIVIDTSVVKKLSAIDGFDGIDSNRLTLCLKYKEKNVHPVYSVNKQSADTEYEYNRIKEEYSLFLTATEDITYFEMETEFLSRDIIYKDEDYEIVAELPATVCKNHYAKLVVKVTKHSDTTKPFSFEGILQLPAFLAQDGTHELTVAFSKLNLICGESTSQEFWLFVQEQSSLETVLMMKNAEMTVTSGDHTKLVSVPFSMTVLISDIQPRELVDRELGKTSLELREMGEVQDFITLADISLIRTDSAYIIEHIEERNVKKYIETPAQSIGRGTYLEYFKGREFLGLGEPATMSEEQMPQQTVKEPTNFKVTTGTLEIPIGGHAHAGDIFYSGEIMHGMGEGTIYVEIGQELIEDDRAAGANVKSTIYGNTALFKETEGRMTENETAVKVLNDKGSFIAAVRFTKDTDCLMLTYRWVAIRFAATGFNENGTPAMDQWIVAETPTIVLGTREQYYVGVKFNNMEKCSIIYELSEAGGGEITGDGVYTAPNKEGVFEIKVYCAEHPSICTYVYAIVKKK